MRFLCVLFLSLGLLRGFAQQTEVFSSDIYTLQTIVNGEPFRPAVIELGSDDEIEISFDQLTHEYRRYHYRISHRNADWEPSALFEGDYLDGFNNLPIEDYETSLNTTMPYTHYSFVLPNDQVGFTKSGNYIVTVCAEDDDERAVFQAAFRVVEKRVNVATTVSTDTDVDRNKLHQQVSFNVNYSGYNIRNPRTEIKVQILQNRRTDNMVTDIVPTHLTASELRYEHNRKLIFEAGNEYRRFEMVNERYASSNVEEIKYYEPYYHATLFADEPRDRNYIYDEDQNGQFLIRYDRATDSNTEADYVFVHFALPYPAPLRSGDFYLQGAFTHNALNERYRLEYNEENRAYETVQLLKQGAYNYQYVYAEDIRSKGTTGLTEGNYYQTGNEYMVFVYHTPFGERYDKLIGYSVVDFKP